MIHRPTKYATRTKRLIAPVHLSWAKSQRGHSRIMMILCIGIPVIAIATLFAAGTSWMAWSTALFLLCPIVMGAMMYMMMRNQPPAVKADGVEDASSQNDTSPEKGLSSTNSLKA